MRFQLQRVYTEICQTLFRQPNISSAAEPLIQRFFPWFSAAFYAGKIVDIQQQADCLRVRLRVSPRFPLFSPGQHVQIRVAINGVATERTFSICSRVQQLQEQREIELAIKIQPHGRFTSALPARLKRGNYVHLSAPAGEFCLPKDSPVCLIGAGSGITPLFSMLSSVSRLTVPMLFIYSYRGISQQLFAEQWQALKAKFPLLTLVLWDSAVQGRLTTERLLNELNPDLRGQFLLCGPHAFTQQLQSQLSAHGVTSTQIRSESYGAMLFSAAESAGATDGAATGQVQLQLGTQLHWLAGHGSLLQLAEQSGLALRYGCRRGVCMQCLCEKSSGIVRNLLTGELSDAGPGQVQLCISAAVGVVELKSQEFSA